MEVEKNYTNKLLEFNDERLETLKEREKTAYENYKISMDNYTMSPEDAISKLKFDKFPCRLTGRSSIGRG